MVDASHTSPTAGNAIGPETKEIPLAAERMAEEVVAAVARHIRL